MSETFEVGELVRLHGVGSVRAAEGRLAVVTELSFGRAWRAKMLERVLTDHGTMSTDSSPAGWYLNHATTVRVTPIRVADRAPEVGQRVAAKLHTERPAPIWVVAEVTGIESYGRYAEVTVDPASRSQLATGGMVDRIAREWAPLDEEATNTKEENVTSPTLPAEVNLTDAWGIGNTIEFTVDAEILTDGVLRVGCKQWPTIALAEVRSFERGEGRKVKVTFRAKVTTDAQFLNGSLVIGGKSIRKDELSCGWDLPSGRDGAYDFRLIEKAPEPKPTFRVGDRVEVVTAPGSRLRGRLGTVEEFPDRDDLIRMLPDDPHGIESLLRGPGRRYIQLVPVRFIHTKKPAPEKEITLTLTESEARALYAVLQHVAGALGARSPRGRTDSVQHKIALAGVTHESSSVERSLLNFRSGSLYFSNYPTA